MPHDERHIDAAIQRLTRPTQPPLVPELTLQLAGPDSLLWSPAPGQLDALGCPHPFWAFAWGGGQALARHLLDDPALSRGKRVLSLGCGCGVEALAAARAGAVRVRATDIDPWALRATRLNAALNGLAVEVAQVRLEEVALAGWDLVLAAEVSYDEASAAALLGRLDSAARRDTVFLLADLDRGFLTHEHFTVVRQLPAPSDVDFGGRYHRHATIYRWPPLANSQFSKRPRSSRSRPARRVR